MKVFHKKEYKYCLDRSFASYDGKTKNGILKVECWHPTKNKNITPRNIAKYCNSKFWFTCDVCNHDFENSLNNITGLNTWCPNCKNKTELKLYNWLTKQHYVVKREFKPKWCSTQFIYLNKKKEFKNGRYQYRYDFLITLNNNTKIIIELDGAQHFKQVSNWRAPLLNQVRDKYKERCASKHNIFLIRCIQEDVFMNRNNWERKLKKKLKKYS